MNEISLQKDVNFETTAAAPECKLFSAVQIFEGTIFGSIITGQIMLAMNYATFGDTKRASRKLLFSLVSPLLCLILFAASSGLYLLVTIGFFIKFYFEFKRRQKIKFSEYLASGGALRSDWEVIVLGVLVNIFLLLLFIIVKKALLNSIS